MFIQPLRNATLATSFHKGHSKFDSFISPEIFSLFFINSEQNLFQTQILTLKLTPNLIETLPNSNPNLDP